MKKRRILLGLALTAASAFTLASCGGVDDDSSNNQSSSVTESSIAASSNAEQSSAAASSAAASSVENSDVYIPSSIESSQSMASSAAQSSAAQQSSAAASSAAAQSSTAQQSSAAQSSAAQSSAAASSSTATADTTYVVQFDANNGSTITSVEVKSGSTVAKPTDPTKDGFEFAGWYLNNSEFNFNTPITAAIKLVAKWNVASDTTTVGFGGSYTSWATLFANSTQKDEKDRTILGTTGEYVEMNNFEFDGKALLDGGILNTNASIIKINLPSNGSINMTATWGSSSDSGVIRVYKDGTQIYESTATYSKSNANISLDLTGLEAGTYEIKAEKTNTTGMAGLKVSKIYYEKLKEYVDVNFVTNSDEELKSVKVEKGSTYTAPTIQKSGFKFLGWYLEPTFDTEFTSTTKVDSTITLYANWKELQAEDLATVTFDSNISEVTFDSVQVEKGTTVVLPSKDVEGYRFAGWYSNAARTEAFNPTTAINDAITIYAKYVKVWTVTYLDYDDTVLTTVQADNGTKFKSLATIYPSYPDGKLFQFWSVDGENEIADVYEITEATTLKPVYKNDDGTTQKIKINSAEGSYESATLKLDAYAGATDYAVYDVTGGKSIRLTQNDYYVIPSSTSVQIEVFGLTKGAHTLLVAPVIGGSDVQGLGSQATFDVTEYDRSGYAHFNYNEGVGAYKDDGTLKDNAIVLYVTDENKNTVTLSFHDSVNNKDYSVSGIGNILNSVGQECGEDGHDGQCKRVSEGKTYYGTANANQGVIKALSDNNIPLVVRFIGCVSNTGLYKQGTFDAKSTGLIEGLTGYNSYEYGGSVGDNGHMARMKSGKNVTLEGVGNDATIDGWGVHFMCENANPEYGKGFEVRNLTFINNPEDALGCEGQQASGLITASVERVWIHNNTFLKPTISNPAESDKKDGDGSCDFKRGMYYTLAYNYFEYCHKTNIIGSADSSLQFNISMHHNLWYQCGSRIPLARQANIHFYNNYICCDSNDKDADLSHVSSLRADAYIYSENNYYDGCKNIFDRSGGTAKVYGCEIVQCFGNNNGTIVNSRDEQVAGNCGYNGTVYQNFDTNKELFYYDDYYLTSAKDARIVVLEQAGSRYRTKLQRTSLGTNTAYNDVTPTQSVTLDKNVIPTSKLNGEYEGVIWANAQSYDSTTGFKARGKFATFKVTKAVTMTLEMTASSTEALNAGSVIKSDGTVMLNGSGEAVLLPGIYVITSCQKDKDNYITKLQFTEFNSEELNQQLIQEYQTAHDAIPATITYTDACYNAIKNAMAKYESLGDLQSQITNYGDVTTAYNSYKSLGVAYVEAEINKIVTPVTASNSSLVISARNAYDALIAKISDATVSNLSKLTSAETEMASLSVDIFLAQVNALPATITYTDECLTAITNAETAYAKLDDTQKNDTNIKTAYATLTAARAKYDSLAKTAAVDELLDNASTLAECETAYEEYNKLSADEKAIIGDESINTFKAKYTVALINSISNPVVRADKTNVDKARALYDTLGSYQSLVTNYSTLTAAEEALAGMSAEEVKKTLTASDFTITGVSTTAFDGQVWSGGSIVGISKATFTDPSKIVLNVTGKDKSVGFRISYSTDGTTWTTAYENKECKGENLSLECPLTVTGDVYIKLEIIGSKKDESNKKQGTINSISITCYE